jgi:pimeloyl-ACP methyl ester carboxylesterase
LKAAGVKYEQRFVQAGDDYINTIKMGQGPPLVLLHGFGAGVGFWVWYVSVCDSYPNNLDLSLNP